MKLGVAVMAVLPSELSQQWPSVGDDAVGPHATALYALIDEGDRDEALAALRGSVEEARRFGVYLGDVESRETGEGLTWAAAVGGDGLHSLRAGCLHALRAAGVPFELTHGGEFWPHATMGAGERPDFSPTGDGVIQHVAIGFGGAGGDVELVELADPTPGSLDDSQRRFVPLRFGEWPEGYAAPTVPAGLHVPDKPWRILAPGEVYQRHNGKMAGRVTVDDLKSMAQVFSETRDESTVPIDWDHTDDASYGRLLDVFVHDEGDGRGPGLYATPGLTPKGVKKVEAYNGGEGRDSFLYSSPLFRLSGAYGKKTGEKKGGAYVARLALTPWPLQAISTIDAVALSETARQPGDRPKEGNGVMTLEEAMAEIERLKTKLTESETALSEKDAEIAKLKEGNGGGEIAASERLAALEAQLLGQKTEMTALSETVTVERTARRAAEKKGAIEHLAHTRRIFPHEIENAKKAYDLKDGDGAGWWLSFAEREIGHAGGTPSVLSRGGNDNDDELTADEKLDAAVRKVVAEKGIGYSEALAQVESAQAPDPAQA